MSMSTTFTSPPTPIRPDQPSELAEDLDADRRHRARAFLPPRFDIHRVADVLGQLERKLELGHDVVIDGSRVQMIDLAAMEATGQLLEQHPGLRIERPSVALQVTVEFTDARIVAASFGFGALEEAA